MFHRQRSYSLEIRQRARELRQAGWSEREIIEELGGDIPLSTLHAWVADIELTAEQQERIGRHNYLPHSPEIREQARELRRAGLTYPEIVTELGQKVAQGTLSGWLSDIELTAEQKARIKQLEIEGSARGRPTGSQWNREQKQKRLQIAKEQAAPIVERLTQNNEALMLMAAALYIGEGSKREDHFSFGNSDPQVIRTWMALLRRNFEIDERKFTGQLAISEGMDDEDLKQYWSEVTKIPLSQFIKSSIDRRPNKKKREGYKGVCKIHYYSLAIRRFLDALGQGVMDELSGEEQTNLGR
jgi:hypothetical protein